MFERKMNIYKLCLKNLAKYLPVSNLLPDTLKRVQYNFQEKNCLAMHSFQLMLIGKWLVT